MLLYPLNTFYPLGWIANKSTLCQIFSTKNYLWCSYNIFQTWFHLQQKFLHTNTWLSCVMSCNICRGENKMYNYKSGTDTWNQRKLEDSIFILVMCKIIPGYLKKSFSNTGFVEGVKIIDWLANTKLYFSNILK